MKIFKLNAIGFIGLLLGLSIGFHWLSDSTLKPQLTKPSVGNVQTLISAYDRWKTRAINSGAAQTLVIPLSHSKTLSSKFTSSKGKATLDLMEGILTIEVHGLPNKEVFNVSMIENSEEVAGNLSQRKTIHVGQLIAQKKEALLQVQLSSTKLMGFELDHIVISQAGQAPETGGLLYGSPSLFQRLYYNELRGLTAIPKPGENTATHPVASAPKWLAPFSFLIPAPAYAQVANSAELGALIAQGEALFFNETFNGNGRTCGTCHRAENNFTIDPDFIATLPDDDPLFVAEFNEELTELEDSALLRDFGLIRANLDGFEDPGSKFVMRSVSHMLGMSLSIQSAATEPPMEMTGWSGDGAPGNGTLREFTTGAVIQHFTKTLDRVPGEDFRLPTDAELDAIEAFTLSLGRQEEMNFATMQLTDSAAERGRILFITEDSEGRTVQAGKCNICHRNGGALTAAGVNQNLDTGVENMLHPAGSALPRDDGFGTQENDSTGGFGDGTFNTASIIEAADTAPYFHHNAAASLEDAIAHYDSPEFRNSIEGQRLMLQDSGGQEMSVEVDVLAAFLRVINALENIRSVTDFLERSKFGVSVADSQGLLHLAQADLSDAIEVLNQSELHEEDGVPHLEIAQSLIDNASNAENVAERDDFIDQALAETQTAKSVMVIDSGPDTTLPTVAVTSPAADSTVTGVVTVSVDASDNTGIDRVIFTVDATEIGQDSSLPFEQAWNTSLFPEGITQLSATAVDTSGNTHGAILTVTVTHAPAADTTPPTVSITSLTDGSSVSGNITITADAADDAGVDRVIFMHGSNEIGQDTSAPFEQAFNTTTIANSTIQITAMAIDTSGNDALASVSVTVSNALPECTVYSCPLPPPPPTEPPPPPTIPVDSSPDGEFDGEIISKDSSTSTVTISTENGTLTLKITSSTEFMGNVALDFHTILVGHIVQGEFFSSVGEALWIEADFPPGF